MRTCSGLDVTVVEKAPQLMSTFDIEMTQPLLAAMRKAGVQVRRG